MALVTNSGSRRAAMGVTAGNPRFASLATAEASAANPLVAPIQGTLGGWDPIAVCESTAPTRIDLDGDCWVEHHLGWLAGSDALFARLTASLPFTTFRRPMYDRMVTVPRLSWFGAVDDPQLPSVVASIADALATRFGPSFEALGCNLYRTGADSVAWHSDRIGRARRDPMVALVSLGQHRPLLLRPKGGGPSQRFMLGGGDLFVMGGAVQHRWEHAVPKVAHAGPRLSLGFRDPRGLLDQDRPGIPTSFRR